LDRITIIVIVVSYLLGSIPFGYLLVRIFRGQDVREVGSHNIGATNVARTGSKGLAVATLILDVLKGYAAVATALWLGRPSGGRGFDYSPEHHYLLAALAGFFAMVGHMFPAWLGFKGGKGVATAVGAFAAIAPRAVLVSLALFVVIVAISRYVSLGSIFGTLVFPFAAWWLNPHTRHITVMFYIVAASLLIVVRHKDNIRRLVAGNENRLW